MEIQKPLEIEIDKDKIINLKMNFKTLIVLVALISGAGAWMTMQEVRGQSMAENVSELQVQQKSILSSFMELQREQINTLHKIDLRLDRIEQKLNRSETR